MINFYKYKRYFLFFAGFLLLCVTAVTVMFGMYNFERERMHYLKSLMDNTKSRVDIHRFIRIRVSEVNNYLHLYIESKKFSEMDRYEARIFEDLDSIREELNVLENGGVLNEKLPLGGASQDVFTNEYRYLKNDGKHYDPRIIDMRAKLEELRIIVRSYRNYLINRVSAEETGSFELGFASEKSIRVMTKEIDNFFTDFQMITNEAYASGLSDMKVLSDYINSEGRRMDRLSMWISLFFGTAIVLYGARLSYVIWSVLKDASDMKRSYDDLSMNFDTKLKSRTLELFGRLDEIIKSESDYKLRYEQMMKVLDSMNSSFYVIDVKNYEIVYANSHASDRENILGKTCHSATHKQLLPCSGKDHPCPLQIVTSTGKPVTVEHIHRTADGTDHYFEIRAYPIKDEYGEVVKMLEISVDISEWKQTEKFLIQQQKALEEKLADYSRIANEQSRLRQNAEVRLEDKEKRFRYLIENITDVIVVLDSSGRIKYASPSMDRIVGFNSRQIRSKFLEDIIFDSDRHFFNEWMSDIKSGGTETRYGEFRIVKRGGDIMFAEASAVNMSEDPVVAGIVFNIRDVSARKTAEKEIRKLALVMDQSPVSILITDTEGVIEYVNPMFEKVTGYSQAEALGKKPSILKWDESSTHIFVELWDTIKSGQVWQGTFTNKRKNGEKYYESAVIAPITNTDGEIISFVAIKEDITELLLARKRAEDANIAKSRFIANISHEIRTPLNSIIGFSDVLKITGLNDKQRGYLATVRSNAETLLDIFNGIMDLADTESEEFSIDSHMVNVDVMAETVNRVHRRAAEVKKISFLNYIDPAIPKKLKGDSFRVGQVVSNLLSNAVKFTENGGRIELNIRKTAETENTVSVEFEVKDTGIGISEQKLAIIFENFEQGDSGVTRRFGGAGLGLSIAANILKKFNSELKVESRKGEGSRFWFEIEFERFSEEPRQNQTAGGADSKPLFRFSLNELSGQIGLAAPVLSGLLSEFCTNSSQELKKAMEEISAGNVRNASDLLHSVRSAAGNLRLEMLSEKLKNADEFVKKNNVDYVKELIREITAMLDLIKFETERRD